MSRKYKPETIVEKFFHGELKDEDGELITVEQICDWPTWDIKDTLLFCLKEYGIKK